MCLWTWTHLIAAPLIYQLLHFWTFHGHHHLTSQLINPSQLTLILHLNWLILSLRRKSELIQLHSHLCKVKNSKIQKMSSHRWNTFKVSMLFIFYKQCWGPPRVLCMAHLQRTFHHWGHHLMCNYFCQRKRINHWPTNHRHYTAAGWFYCVTRRSCTLVRAIDTVGTHANARDRQPRCLPATHDHSTEIQNGDLSM